MLSSRLSLWLQFLSTNAFSRWRPSWSLICLWKDVLFWPSRPFASHSAPLLLLTLFWFSFCRCVDTLPVALSSCAVFTAYPSWLVMLCVGRKTIKVIILWQTCLLLFSVSVVISVHLSVSCSVTVSVCLSVCLSLSRSRCKQNRNRFARRMHTAENDRMVEKGAAERNQPPAWCSAPSVHLNPIRKHCVIYFSWKK